MNDTEVQAAIDAAVTKLAADVNTEVNAALEAMSAQIADVAQRFDLTLASAMLDIVRQMNGALTALAASIKTAAQPPEPVVPIVNVYVPEPTPPAPKQITFERDADGKIIGAEETVKAA